MHFEITACLMISDSLDPRLTIAQQAVALRFDMIDIQYPLMNCRVLSAVSSSTP